MGSSRVPGRQLYRDWPRFRGFQARRCGRCRAVEMEGKFTVVTRGNRLSSDVVPRDCSCQRPSHAEGQGDLKALFLDNFRGARELGVFAMRYYSRPASRDEPN